MGKPGRTLTFFSNLFLRCYQSSKIGDCCGKKQKKNKTKTSKLELVYFVWAPTFTPDVKLAGNVVSTSGVNCFNYLSSKI